MMPDDPTEPEAFVRDHKPLLVRVLAYGDAEARSYALALLANGGDVNDIEEVQDHLDELKREVQQR